MAYKEEIHHSFLLSDAYYRLLCSCRGECILDTRNPLSLLMCARLTFIYHSTFCLLFALHQKQNIGIVLVLLIIEVMAATWYAISYIPFGRKLVIAFLRRTICKPCFAVYDSAKGTGGGGKSGGSSMGLASQSEL